MDIKERERETADNGLLNNNMKKSITKRKANQLASLEGVAFERWVYLRVEMKLAFVASLATLFAC